ncbi:MAG: DUF4012 domain-containing protein [Chloroflexi bacterium]|nr:DUF4012 domain-containing protein [Chloroflexota bacterium]
MKSIVAKALLGFLALSLLAVLVLFGWGWAQYARIQAGLERLERTLDMDAAGVAGWARLLEDVEEVNGELASVRSSLEAARSALGTVRSLLPLFSWVPSVGQDVQEAPALVDLSLDVVSLGEEVGKGLLPIAQELKRSPQGLQMGAQGGIPRYLELLREGKPHFRQARGLLGGVRDRLREMESARVSEGTRARLQRLGGFLPTVDHALFALTELPPITEEFLGFRGRRTYLVLAQNTYELRATGGFISGVWLVTLRDGDIEEMSFHDSGEVDILTKTFPPAPAPMRKYMQAGIWPFRDTNWFAHFPDSARAAENLYELGQNIAVDGVIAVNERVMEEVVEAVGPIYLEAYGTEVTRETFLRLLEQGIEPSGVGPGSLQPRKFLLKVLGEELRGRLESGLGLEKTLRLLSALARSLEGRHVLLYTHTGDVQEILAQLGWDGGVREGPGDYLRAVDSNMSFNKVNRSVTQSILYAVHLDEAEPWGEVSLRYRNESQPQEGVCIQDTQPGGYEVWKQGCYWAFVRVLVPQGSRLRKASYVPLPEGSLLKRMGREGETATVEIAKEGGKTSFGLFFVVAPGEEREISFAYTLPGDLAGKGLLWYELTVQKQPGTVAVPLEVVLHLPPDAAAMPREPTGGKVEGGTVRFVTDLAQDRSFSVGAPVKSRRED